MGMIVNFKYSRYEKNSRAIWLFGQYTKLRLSVADEIMTK